MTFLFSASYIKPPFDKIIGYDKGIPSKIYKAESGVLADATVKHKPHSLKFYKIPFDYTDTLA